MVFACLYLHNLDSICKNVKIKEARLEVETENESPVAAFV